LKHIAEDVYLLDGFPPDAINVYLVGDVLIDAGTRHASKRILRQLRGRTVSAHALTHAHPDHQGASHEICETRGIPLWCGEGDAEAIETGNVTGGETHSLLHRVIGAGLRGPAHPVARRLHESDVVARFEVLETPGHSAGHVSFWRASDRTLICGDVFINMPPMTGLHEPPAIFTPDPARNRESMRRLAALEPELVCFGHGPPLRDPAKLRAFTDGLAP